MYRGIGILSKGVSACMQPAARPSSPRDNRLKEKALCVLHGAFAVYASFSRNGYFFFKKYR